MRYEYITYGNLTYREDSYCGHEHLAGVESREPFNGINIRVTTYSDGSRHTEKVVR